VPAYTALQLLAGTESLTLGEQQPTGNVENEPETLRAAPPEDPARRTGSTASLFPSLDQPAIESPFGNAARTALVGFLFTLNELIAAAPSLTVSQLLTLVIDKVRYRDYLTQAFPVDGEERWENVMELRNVASQWDDLESETGLMRFLEDVALMSDQDEYDERAEAVTLITLHAAKGLEFQVVFMVGMEEGLLPHIRSFDDPNQMEEERRLCYVGVTRAKDRLYLLRAFRRSFMGHSGGNPASRFLKDLPPELVHRISQDVESAYQRPSPSRQPSWSQQAFGDVEPKRTRLGRAEPGERALVATYSAGEHVRHARFGEGIVISATMTANGNDQEVTVAFKGEGGVKKLLLSFAPLEKLD
jgi:DNA helicase-2/ATP-dependent DNA helicase PcrA